MVPGVDLSLGKVLIDMLLRLARLATICLILWGLVLGARARADEPDFSVLERMSLPWACGQGHRITWDPESHWTNGNSRGLAFDFSMVEGTTILAPADGVATYKSDQKPFIPNLGNYVDLVIEGGWRLRFAHLRDAQEGERQVRAGEILGYSGASGAARPHLHTELFAPGRTSWSSDDTPKIAYYFGVPFGEWVEQAMMANRDCPANVILSGAVRAIQPAVELGEPIDLVVPLRNIGSQETTLRAVQVLMSDSRGTTVSVEAQGQWPAGIQQDQEIQVRAWPNMAGSWQVQRVTLIGDSISASLPASASWTVHESPLKLVGVRVPGALMVSEHLALEVWIENTGPDDVWLDDIHAQGAQPDHQSWGASSGHGQYISAGETARLALEGNTLPQHVGSWDVEHVAFQQGDHLFRLAEVQESFVVLGPQLVVEEAFASAADGVLSIFLTLKNQGTDVAAPESIQVWGWQPEAEQDFSVSTEPSLALKPGEAALIRLDTPLQGIAGSWQVVEAGYWSQGTFCRMPLPTMPLVLVPAEAVAPLQP